MNARTLAYTLEDAFLYLEFRAMSSVFLRVRSRCRDIGVSQRKLPASRAWERGRRMMTLS
jgi:hypothetical protein